MQYPMPWLLRAIGAYSSLRFTPTESVLPLIPPFRVKSRFPRLWFLLWTAPFGWDFTLD